jgi:hypothetical protein
MYHCSPSDLDADFEDNQDYDSTVSQSETKLPAFNPGNQNEHSLDASDFSADRHAAVMNRASYVSDDSAELRRVCRLVF